MHFIRTKINMSTAKLDNKALSIKCHVTSSINGHGAFKSIDVAFTDN